MYTTTELLSLIKKRAFIPTSQGTFSDEDLLDMATDEMRSIIVPAILSAREEWYVTSQTTELTDSLHSTGVSIPPRSIGGGLREVSFVRGGLEYNLARQSLEDKVYRDSQGPLSSFYIEGSSIKFIGKEPGSLRLYYHCRPGALVPTSEASKIGSVDTGTKTFTSSFVPTAWVSGTVIDIVSGSPHFDHKAVSLTIDTVTTSTITVVEDIPDTVVVGDWISLEDESAVPQIPVEWGPYLAQAVVVQVLESEGDFEAASRAAERRDTLHKHAMQVITPRVHGETKKAVAAKNRGSVINPTWSGS